MARLQHPTCPSNGSRARVPSGRGPPEPFLRAFAGELDAQQGRSLAKRLLDAVVGLALVSYRGFERPQQTERPAVLASGEIEAPGALLTREDVDVVGRDTLRLERPHRCGDLLLAVEEARHPVDEREQMPPRVGIAVDSGHRLPPEQPFCSLTETRSAALIYQLSSSGPLVRA